MIKKPTFLLCSERSGSNLIRAIMDSHSQVYAPMPLHLVRHLWYNVHRFGDLAKDTNWNALIDQTCRFFSNQNAKLNFTTTPSELAENALERNFSSIFDYIYDRGIKTSKKQLLFLKENHTWRYIHFLLAYYHDAKFVWQIRDPRDVVLSMKKLQLSSNILERIAMWQEDQQMSLRAYSTLGPQNFFALRYEDLLSNPQRVLAALCNFLEIPFEQSMLEFHNETHSKMAASASVAWKNLEQPLMQNNFNKFSGELSPSEVAIIESEVGDLMKHFNYQPSNSKMPKTSSFLKNTFPKWYYPFLERKNNLKKLPVSPEELGRRNAFRTMFRDCQNEQNALEANLTFTYTLN